MHAFIDGSESYRSGREQVSLNLPWLVIRIYIYMIIWRIRIYYIIFFIYVTKECARVASQTALSSMGERWFSRIHAVWKFDIRLNMCMRTEVHSPKKVANSCGTKSLWVTQALLRPRPVSCLYSAWQWHKVLPHPGVGCTTLHVIVHNCRNIMKD